MVGTAHPTELMKRFAFIICFLFLPFEVLAAEGISVEARVESGQTVYVGSKFRYKITIHGVNQPGEIDLKPLSAYSPEFAGRESVYRFGVQYYAMNYNLLARKAGTIKLPSINVIVGGKVYPTEPVSVKVVEPPGTDRFELELLVPKNKCYVGEPVEISLKWFVKTEIARTKKIAGVSFLSPIFSSDSFRIERVINEPFFRANRERFEGFQINGKGYPFAKRSVRRDGVEWIELSYSAVFIPRNVGNISIEPSSVIVDFVVSQDIYSGGYKTERFMAKTDETQLEVVPLPDVDRPKEAYGLVGNYKISASAKPVKVDVGQPITLTVKVGGSRLLSPVQWPDIENMDGFADNFKISSQREDPVVKGGEKIFTVTIRAANDSVTEIPAVPLVFFDTQKGEYVTVKSKPIPLTVNPSDVFTIGDVEFTGKGAIGSHVEAVKKGMAANVVDIDLVSQEFSPLGAIVSPGYLSLWGLPFAAFVVSVIVRVLTNTSDAKIAASRRRKARKNAESMLKAAKSKEDLAVAMREYVGWRFGKSSGALTGMDCERIIAESTGEEGIAKEYRSILEKCEAAQYTGGGGTCDPDEINNIINIISRIDKKT